MFRLNATTQSQTAICLKYNTREQRLAKGLSQEDLADLCGLHRTYVGSVERGERNISIDNMERIALALEVDLESLIKGATS